ncbi:hypothetical protein PQX77_020768 [Marasmius sp. AFHP31]|nr:hypothetical protein PQX77_020768 [Marasmius sp. AFHP31]
MASEQDIAKQAVEAYTSVGNVIVYPISTLSVMSLVYGVYIIIFGLSLDVLWHRSSPASKAYTRWIIALFVLNTISNASIGWLQIGQALDEFHPIKTSDYIPYLEDLSGKKPSEWAAQLGLGALSSVIISCVFDYLMVHRCYVIWGHSKWILYPFGLVAFVTDGFVLYVIEIIAYQYNNHALFIRLFKIGSVFVVISAVYASLLTLLTAGRIWWTVRQVEQITGNRIYTRYKIFVATILESGLLYSIMIVISMVLPLIIDPSNTGIIPFDFSVISVQMAGIAPTVIIVRITYGQAVESVQQMVSTLQFAEEANNSQQQSMAAQGTINLQQSLLE